MKRKEPVITQDELAAAIEEARNDFLMKPDPRVPGELTIEEWSEELGIGVTMMRLKMKRAVASGLYEKAPCRAIDSRGKMYTMQIYRRKKKA